MPDYYTSQSRTSDPGKYRYLLDALPTDLAGISQIIEGLIYHYFAGQRLYGWVPPKERLSEIIRSLCDRGTCLANVSK